MYFQPRAAYPTYAYQLPQPVRPIPTPVTLVDRQATPGFASTWQLSSRPALLSEISKAEQAQCQPKLLQTAEDSMLPALEPRLYAVLQAQNLPEGLIPTLKMYRHILKTLDPKTQKLFKALMDTKKLTTGRADDGHSVLYHLYGILTTPRGSGYQAKTILRETIEILARPAKISQRFAPLSDQGRLQLMQARNRSAMQSQGSSFPLPPAGAQDLDVESSATCVASSVMYYMASKEPADFTRHINELTSPINAFWEKARFEEISPDNPAHALQMLQEKQIPFYLSAPNEVVVKVSNPETGIVRAVQSQQVPVGSEYRNGIESAYQSAMTYLATHSYDPATDLRDGDAPGTTSPGLTEPEKTLIEAIVKDNGGVQSITYQMVAGKAMPGPGEEANSYLYGYNRSFQEMESDILAALSLNEPVIIGTTDTDASGAIVAGHEITITRAFLDPQDRQLKFEVADSDDGIPTLVYKSARDLIPTIHHAGLPVPIARQIRQQMQMRQLGQGAYLVPDQQDSFKYKLLSYQKGPIPLDQIPGPSNATFNPKPYNTPYPTSGLKSVTQGYYAGLWPAASRFSQIA